MFGTDGDDTLHGTAGDDEIYGVGGNDSIVGAAGLDLLDGGDGADTILGGASVDWLYGGAGDDLVTDDGKADNYNELHGGDGRDSLSASSGFVVLLGDEGDDRLTLTGSAGGLLDGGTGNDVLGGGDLVDELHGGAGADTLRGGGDMDVYAGSLAELDGDLLEDYAFGEQIRVVGAGLSAGALSLGAENGRTYLAIDADGDGHADARINFAQQFDGAVIVATDAYQQSTIRIVSNAGYGTPSPGDDYLVGTAAANSINALAGRDELLGLAGDDSLSGGADDDTIHGGDGADLLDGEDGFDQLHGGAGNDTLTDSGTDWGDARLYGDGGDDLIFIERGTAQADGGAGDDEISFRLEAAGAAYGGQGADTLVGGLQADSLSGGADADVLIGGGGKDIFEGYAPDLNGDRIADYQFGEAIRILSATTGAAAVRLAAAGVDTLLQIDADRDGVFETNLTLSGLSGGQLAVGEEDLTTTVVTVTANRPPVAPSSKSFTTNEDTATHVAVGASDPEGDPLVLAMKAGSGPAHGSVSFTDAGFVYAPHANYNGADAFIVTISDGRSVIEQSVSVTVKALNDAPTLIAPPDQDAAQGSFVSLDLSRWFSDVDGDALAYSVTQASGAALPTWLKLDGAVLSGTPTGVEDLVSIKVTARDPGGLAVSDTFDLLVGRSFTGGGGADRYTGGRGDDTINGAKGADELNGAAGDDLIIGGAGDDRLTGGLGADVFVFGSKTGRDSISDMTIGQDLIRLEGVGASGWQMVKGNTVVSLSDGGAITLVGRTLTDATYSALFG